MSVRTLAGIFLVLVASVSGLFGQGSTEGRATCTVLEVREMKGILGGLVCPDVGTQSNTCTGVFDPKQPQNNCPAGTQICAMDAGGTSCILVNLAAFDRCKAGITGWQCTQNSTGNCGAYYTGPVSMGVCPGCPTGPLACGEVKYGVQVFKCP